MQVFWGLACFSTIAAAFPCAQEPKITEAIQGEWKLVESWSNGTQRSSTIQRCCAAPRHLAEKRVDHHALVERHRRRATRERQVEVAERAHARLGLVHDVDAHGLEHADGGDRVEALGLQLVVIDQALIPT